MGVAVIISAPRVSGSRRSWIARRRNALLLALAVIAILVVTEVPYVYAYRSAPPDRQFMGILLNVPDTAQYLSWAREASRSIFIENKLTPEPGSAVYFNLFWFAVGRLTVITRLDAVDVLALVRPVAGAFYLVAIYWFVGLVVPQQFQRWLSFLVISLGGGLGWVLVVLKQVTGRLLFPLDIYVTEPNTFLTVMAFPFQAVAGALVLLILGLAALAFERRSFRLATLTGVLALGLGLQHGYDLVIVYAIVGSIVLVSVLRQGFQLRLLALAAVICGWSLPAAAYAVYLGHISPIWRAVLAQYGNAGVFSPDPVHLLLLMGLPLAFLVSSRPKREDWNNLTIREQLLRTWLVVGLALIYVPTNFQIKMLNDWQVPVAILATRSLWAWLEPVLPALVPAIRAPSRLAIAGLLVAAVIPVNLYLFAWRIVDLGRHAYPYYLSTDEVAGLRWLETHSSPSDVVLSSLTIGEYIPSISGNRAFLAHWAETLNFYQKSYQVASFFSSRESDHDRARVLQRFGVSYVFYGDEEKSLGDYDPAKSSYLTRVFFRPHASIYRVEKASLADVAER